MTHFEAYRWEDHVPRAGSWKFNRAAGFLALALITTAFPDIHGNAPAAAVAAVPASAAPYRGMQISNAIPPKIQPVNSGWVHCPATTAKYVDS